VLEYSVRSVTATTATVALRGDMTGERWSQRLRAFLEDRYISDGVRLVELDLEEVVAIDLDGIGALAALARSATERDKRIVVVSPSAQVENRLRQTGILRFLSDEATWESEDDRRRSDGPGAWSRAAAFEHAYADLRKRTALVALGSWFLRASARREIQRSRDVSVFGSPVAPRSLLARAQRAAENVA